MLRTTHRRSLSDDDTACVVLIARVVRVRSDSSSRQQLLGDRKKKPATEEVLEVQKAVACLWFVLHRLRHRRRGSGEAPRGRCVRVKRATWSARSSSAVGMPGGGAGAGCRARGIGGGALNAHATADQARRACRRSRATSTRSARGGAMYRMPARMPAKWPTKLTFGEMSWIQSSSPQHSQRICGPRARLSATLRRKGAEGCGGRTHRQVDAEHHFAGAARVPGRHHFEREKHGAEAHSAGVELAEGAAC